MNFIIVLFRKIIRLFVFVLFYLKEMFIANLLIARDILSLHPRMHPAILKIRLDVKSHHGILSMVNLLSMTPGSLSVDISPDRRYIYVHFWNVTDIEKTKHKVKQVLEKKVRGIFS